MVSLLLLLHALGGQHVEDRVLMQEVVNQNAADFIVVPLFLFTPVLALGLIELRHHSQALLVRIVA